MMLRCPFCKNTMKYQPKDMPKSKRCVYCGRTFTAKNNIIS